MSLISRLFGEHKGVDITVEQSGDQWKYETSTGIWGVGQHTKEEAMQDAKDAIDYDIAADESGNTDLDPDWWL